MNENTYGNPITREQAKRHFELLIQIKKRTCHRLKVFLAADVEAQRYYCGRPGFDPVREDLAFIFDKAAIQEILDKLEKEKAHGMAIFHAVRSKEDSRIGETEEFNDIDGRPTLMIFPFTYKTPETPASFTDDPDLEIDLDKGTEHPGTGGSNGNPIAAPDEFELPASFRANQIHKILGSLHKKAPLIE